MKLPLMLAIAIAALQSQGQNCSNYYYMQNNKTVEMTIYNKKGEPSGKQVYSVSDVKNGGGTTTATVNSEMFDKKGRSIAKGNNSIRCSNGVMQMNMKMVMPQQQGSPTGNINASSEDVFLEYPGDMNVGDQLKDGDINMEIDNNGLKQTVSMSIRNRKVEAKESVTTTAGTWDCYKITYDGKMNVKIMGIGKNMNIDAIEWFAPGFGIVKTSSQYGGTAITAIK